MAFDETADLIGSYEAQLDTLGLLIGDLSEEIQDGSAAWTIAEILNHLLDGETRYGNRIRRVRGESKPQMRVMPNADYTRLSALTAWTQLYELRLRNLELLKSLKKSEWKRSGTLTPVGRVTIESLVRHLVAHNDLHIAQIARRLSGRPD